MTARILVSLRRAFSAIVRRAVGWPLPPARPGQLVTAEARPRTRRCRGSHASRKSRPRPVLTAWSERTPLAKITVMLS